MAAPTAKIKQVFKVEKLNPQQEENIKSLLHIIKKKKTMNTLSGTISVIEDIITVKKHGSS